MQSESMYHVLTKMIEGDQQAFHTLYDATYKDVYRTVSFLVDHPQDREDIMNEIYMQMWTSRIVLSTSGCTAWSSDKCKDSG
ncbi:hypothetical protein PPOLYM_00201 [Paenibacillus polymyxa]|uniref:DNA-directed RNA polymerase specialized sigma24 family protein n=1 Tax=Paenibacillus peoriae TaxID=59893 RepID=A0ABU1QHL0_9BACL|nr:DNA-directed RNA polymerase specialized sigma24 family protein [Paenibacillus peoriae]VUG03828.1 hypothetical protein PPOLYM_00201 [Paenibacillus polymyxa]